jgi:hypothetical protein
MLVTAELAAIVEEAYAVFAAYPLREPLAVCRCPLCIDRDTARLLIATHLREMPEHLLNAYTQAAHPWSAHASREMRYFLPRYLEWIAYPERQKGYLDDWCLRRLGKGDWRSAWPAAERDLVDRFFDALLGATLAQPRGDSWNIHWWETYTVETILKLIVGAGGDLERILDVWNRAPDPHACLQMALLRPRVYFDGSRHFWSVLPSWESVAADRIGAFLARPEVTERIELTLFSDEEPRFERILTDGLQPFWPAPPRE